MQHHFDTEIAKEYGILEAVIINHLNFWIVKNEANDQNYYDGDYWTYNSTRAFAELLPYATERQIKYALRKLRNLGIIKTANHNKYGYDRTLWYTFTEKGKAIVQNCPMEETNLSNPKSKIV